MKIYETWTLSMSIICNVTLAKALKTYTKAVFECDVQDVAFTKAAELTSALKAG